MTSIAVYECMEHTDAGNTTAYPLSPCQPPLFRSPTPSGLPEFGSREAQELRLLPPSGLQRLTEALQRRVRQLEHNSESNTEDERDRATSSQHNVAVHRAQTNFETPASILRRMMGTISPVSVPRPPHRPRRAGLPKGVIRASQPGPLTRADDGSQVRGRFGNRASGHGVGQRTISIHPLARLRNSSGLQDAIEEIEKACAREDERQQRSEHEARQGQRRRGSAAESQDHAVHAMGGLAVSHAPEDERRAVQGLGQQGQENTRLQAQLKVIQAPRSSLNAAVSGHHVASSNSTEQRTARIRQLGIEDAIASGHLQVTSDQTVTSLSPDATIGTASPLNMVEPGLYSSYSSYSYSSTRVSSPRTAHVQDDAPTTNSSLEQQRPGDAASTDPGPQQQLSEPRESPFNIC
ncbi:hypothetical protein LTR70_002949 [Exophiala xenobiotica]|uniref:Uncharacterized protein n=1 Tax=Lithohypha guttulata TaxID=1690604 RepID=A0ABR0K7K2_9EURO|nr:hypothetical protein LTR24_006502 [Lithohypha guttulata]KAK5324319.1 hypothetical protein LTR70_002949 [Exophiala xenobiotica]